VYSIENDEEDSNISNSCLVAIIVDNIVRGIAGLAAGMRHIPNSVT